MLAQSLIAASAGVILTLGTVHLVYTFFTDKFDPRDPALKRQMQSVSPVLTSRTSLWQAWVGFNASHSLGAMAFGLIYGYLALCRLEWLAGSAFLGLLGLVLLASYLWLAWRYWFRAPLAGIALALLLYCAGFALVLA